MANINNTASGIPTPIPTDKLLSLVDGAADVVCAGVDIDPEPELEAEEEVVFEGCERSPVMLTCRMGPGAKL